MSAEWAAGAVRARAIAQRRAGRSAARDCASSGGLAEGLRMVATTTYGRRIHPAMDLGAAEHEIEQSLLWNLRVLAGWQPRAGADLLRICVCGFEAADVVSRLRELGGGRAGPPYDLGALATAWPRVRNATTPTQIRTALAASPWGDPGAEDVASVTFYLRLSGALRLSGLGPEAARWAAGDAAVAVGREAFLAQRRIGAPAVRVGKRLLGANALRASSWEEFVERLPANARWALDEVPSPDQLWRAEITCHLRKEADSHELLRGGELDAKPVLAAAMLLVTDAWRLCAALESAARDGRARPAGQAGSATPAGWASEVFDAVA